MDDTFICNGEELLKIVHKLKQFFDETCKKYDTLSKEERVKRFKEFLAKQ